MAQLYKHFSDYQGDWPWKNFSPKEVSCKHCGELHLDHDAMDALQSLRDAWGKPIVVTSGHRCSHHNHTVGGGESSQHLKIAFDCACPRNEQDAFIATAMASGFTGVGRYSTFVHLDCGPRREWRG